MDEKEIKITLKALVVSNPLQMTLNDLCRDFQKETGQQIPYQQFGYNSLYEYLKSMPDYIQILGYGPRAEVRAVLSKESAHIADLVSRQRVVQKRNIKKPRARVVVDVPAYPPAAKGIKTINDEENLKILFSKHSKGILAHNLLFEYHKAFRCHLSYEKYECFGVVELAWKWKHLIHTEQLPNGNYLLSSASNPVKVQQNEKTTATTQKPTATTQKPAATTQKPTVITQKPAATTQKPATKTKETLSNGNHLPPTTNNIVKIQQNGQELPKIQKPEPKIKTTFTTQNHVDPDDKENECSATSSRDFRISVTDLRKRLGIITISKRPQLLSSAPIYPPEVFQFGNKLPRESVMYDDDGYLEVRVEEVFDASNFWFIMLSKIRERDNMMTDMQYVIEYMRAYQMRTFYPFNLELIRVPSYWIDSGIYCVVYCYGVYNRGLILCTDVENLNTSVKVQCIDYGNIVTVDIYNIYFLHNDYAKLPAQALHGRAANIQPCQFEHMWPKEATKFFKDLVLNKKLVAECLYFEEDDTPAYHLQLSDTSSSKDIDVSGEMVYKGHAVFSNKIRNLNLESNSTLENTFFYRDFGRAGLISSTLIRDMYRFGYNLKEFVDINQERDITGNNTPKRSVTDNMNNILSLL